VVGTVIDKAVLRDSRRDYDPGEMRKARQELLEFIVRRPGQVRAQITCIDAAGNEVDGDGHGHGSMDCNDSDPAIHPGAAEGGNGVDDDCSDLVDDAPACPCEVVVLDGVAFHLCNLPMPWTEAAAFCEAQGCDLGRIDTPEQSWRPYQIAHERNDKRWWIGLSDREKESHFEWYDGALVEITYWSRGEPDNDACNQDCAALKADSGGKWHDTHCRQHEPFICR
jgi:hypothetical protein